MLHAHWQIPCDDWRVDEESRIIGSLVAPPDLPDDRLYRALLTIGEYESVRHCCPFCSLRAGPWRSRFPARGPHDAPAGSCR
jgi:hypothetical protein